MNSLRDLWNNHRSCNIHIVRVPGEERESGAEKTLEEIMAENFQNLAKDITLTDSKS